MNDDWLSKLDTEMITVAARIPLEHMRALKRIAIAYDLRTTSDLVRAAVAEFVYNHQGETNHDEK